MQRLIIVNNATTLAGSALGETLQINVQVALFQTKEPLKMDIASVMKAIMIKA